MNIKLEGNKIIYNDSCLVFTKKNYISIDEIKGDDID